MNKLLLLAFLIAAPLCLKAQDRAALEQNAQKMMDFTVSKNYQALLDLTYPKIFEIVPRDQMMQILTNMMNGDGFSITLLPAKPNFTFGDIKKIDKGTYCVFEHDLAMKMTFTEPVEDVEMMLGIFKTNLKTDDVTYDAGQNSFTIKKRAQVIAVADALSNNKWTFVNNDGGRMMHMIFPDTVMKQLGL